MYKISGQMTWLLSTNKLLKEKKKKRVGEGEPID